MENQLNEIVDFLPVLFGLAVKVFLASIAIWPFAKVVFPHLWAIAVKGVTARIPDKNIAAAVQNLAGAVGIAAPQAIDAFYKAVQSAQRPDSPGGATITPEEWTSIMAEFSAVSMKALSDQKVLDSTAKVFGGREALRNAAMGDLKTEVLRAAKAAGIEVPMQPAEKAAPRPSAA